VADRPAARPSGRPSVRGELLVVLKLLAHDGADHTPVVLTSRELGERVGVSQQAADRYLLDLERNGLLVRALANRRQRLQLTASAMELLRGEYRDYRRIFEGPGHATIAGEVASGLGEGRYYLSQPGYVVQFTERLGYSPYPGTLNVRVKPSEARRLAVLHDWSGIRIDGFEAGGRTFGGATCFPARLNGHPCHLIHPDRSHYRDVVEFVAADCLRESLHLKDGDRVATDIEEP
jgi:riboflavin kinase, archaea type